MAKYHPREALKEKAILKLLQKEHDVHTFDDMPPGILATSLVLWGALLSLFWLFFAADAQSRFAAVVDTIFIAIFFAIPMLMARQAKPKLARHGDDVAICTGTVSTFDAAIQVILIPAALVTAIAVMGAIKMAVMAG